MTRKFLSFLVASLLFALGAAAQNGEVSVPNDGPRVGVVMSGGGAKGLYHIGVLQALEENNIPIDYVSGTSMGSIIAAMYAAGYSPAQMREIVCSGVVKQWVSGRIDPTYVPYYRRNTNRPAFFSVRLRLRENPEQTNISRFELPNSLISSSQIDLALAELFAPASTAAGGDFSRLMVPFLCVASDMNSRRPVVFRRGDLGAAVRASMSIPLAFQPVKLDSMLLYDGGIYDNFPWRPMDRQFKPDFIIGSKCTAGNTPVDEGSSIVNQAFMISMGRTDYRLPADRSLMIERAVEVNMLDFSNPEAVIEAGYQDALAQIDALKERIGREATVEQVEAKREAFRETCKPLVLSRYEIEGLSGDQEQYVRDLMGLKRSKSGQEPRLSFSDFRSHFFALMGNNEFSSEYPVLRYDSLEEGYVVGLNMTTRPNSRVFIGGNISSTVFNQAFIGFDYHRIRRVSQRLFAGIYLGPIYSTGSVGGHTNFFYLQKPFALNYSYNFAVKAFRHGSFGNLTRINNVGQMKSSENFLALDISMPLGQNSLLSLQTNGGLESYRSYDASRFNLFSDTDLTRFLFFGTKLEIIRNSLDKPLHPRRGSDISFSGFFLTGRERYRPFLIGPSPTTSDAHREWIGARFRASKYLDIPRVKWFSIGFSVDAIWTSHPHLHNLAATQISLPAYQPVIHSQMSYMPDYHAWSYFAGGVMPTFDLLPNFFLRTGFYTMWRDNRGLPGRRMQYITEAALVYHTPIGPVSLAVTKYDVYNWSNMYLTFNFGYAIFAPGGKFY